MRFQALLLLLSLTLSALWRAEAQLIESDLKLDSVIVLAPFDQSRGDIAPQPVLLETGLTGTVQTLLENGVRVRARLSGRLQADHPLRPGGSGAFAEPALSAGNGFSGLGLSSDELSSSTRARLESAYLQIDGGYGEIRMGKDQGVAARFHEGAPSTLTHARLDSALLDPTGLSIVRTRHDLTGPSAKLSYASPRLLGIRAGISLTPEARADGLDRRPDAAGADIEAAIELALNVRRVLPDWDTRIDIGLAWSHAQLAGRPGLFEKDLQTFSAGTRIAHRQWQFGGSVLSSNDGYRAQDYAAWSVGLAYDWTDYMLALNYGEADDTFSQISGQSWRLGLEKEIDQNTRISLNYIDDRLQTLRPTRQSRGIVVEITLSEEIADFSKSSCSLFAYRC